MYAISMLLALTMVAAAQDPAQGRGRGVQIKPDNVTLDWMTPHQNMAVQKLIECQDQFSALSGVAGAGKTSKVLSSVIGANLKEGRKVAIVATSNAAARC